MKEWTMKQLGKYFILIQYELLKYIQYDKKVIEKLKYPHFKNNSVPICVIYNYNIIFFNLIKMIKFFLNLRLL